MVEDDRVYFCCRDATYRLELDGAAREVFRLPADYIAGRELRRVGTHLMVPADGRYFLVNGEVGNHWFVGLADRQTGDFKLIKEFAHHFNHAQFSPRGTWVVYTTMVRGQVDVAFTPSPVLKGAG